MNCQVQFPFFAEIYTFPKGRNKASCFLLLSFFFIYLSLKSSILVSLEVLRDLNTEKGNLLTLFILVLIK